MGVFKKASQIRCAGVGTVMRSAESLTQRADTLYQDSNALLNSLLLRGEAVEAELKHTIASRKANMTLSFKGTNMIDNAFNSFLAKFGLVEDRRDKKLDELSSKVDNLVEVVAKLAAMKAAEKRAAATPAADTAAKKPVARAAATSKATKTEASATKPAASTAAKATAKAATRKRSSTKTKPAESKSDNAAKE